MEQGSGAVPEGSRVPTKLLGLHAEKPTLAPPRSFTEFLLS